MAKRIGALWLKESRKGQKYFSGTLDLGALGAVQIAIFKNQEKEKDNQPDYYMLLSEPAQPKPEEKAPAAVDKDDDIPF